MKKIFVVAALLAMVLGLTAFQCSSTELTSAKLYIQQKNLPKAKTSLLKEVEKNPKSDEGYYLLGYVQGEQKEYTEMLESYDKSLAISQKFASDIEASKKYHWAENFNRGVALFNKAGKQQDVDSAKIVFDKCIETFNVAIACQPDSMDTYSNLAFAYLNKGDYQGAIGPFEKVIELAPNADTYSRLGEIYFTIASGRMGAFETSKNVADSVLAMENYSKAIAVLEKGRELYPEDGNILLYLSNSYIGAGKLDVAMDAFKAGVEQDPENKNYRYNYGSLLLNADLYSEAEPQFKKALEIDPAYTNAVYNLAVTYVKWGAKLREDDIAAGGESEEYKEKFKQALPHLEKYVATEEGSSNAAMWELLGKVYLNLGEKEKSEEAYKKADSIK